MLKSKINNSDTLKYFNRTELEAIATIILKLEACQFKVGQYEEIVKDDNGLIRAKEGEINVLKSYNKVTEKEKGDAVNSMNKQEKRKKWWRGIAIAEGGVIATVLLILIL